MVNTTFEWDEVFNEPGAATEKFPSRRSLHAVSNTERIVPADVKTAAWRAFVRTTAQAYAASLSTAVVSVAGVLAFIQNFDPILFIATGIVALGSPLLAGLAAYLNIISQGIPEDYLGPNRLVQYDDPVGPLTDN